MNVEVAVVDDDGGRRSDARCRNESPAADVRGGTTGPDPTTCSRPRNPYPVVGPSRDHNMLWSSRLPPPRLMAASAEFHEEGDGKFR